MDQTVTLVLRFFHVVGGILWAGGALLMPVSRVRSLVAEYFESHNLFGVVGQDGVPPWWRQLDQSRSCECGGGKVAVQGPNQQHPQLTIQRHAVA